MQELFWMCLMQYIALGHVQFTEQLPRQESIQHTVKNLRCGVLQRE